MELQTHEDIALTVREEGISDGESSSSFDYPSYSIGLGEDFAEVPTRSPVCTCGKDSGFFCGDRAIDATKKNEHRTLTGNCTADALYYCRYSDSAYPQAAAVRHGPCRGMGKYYQSVETGFDSCHH